MLPVKLRLRADPISFMFAMKTMFIRIRLTIIIIKLFIPKIQCKEIAKLFQSFVTMLCIVLD